MSVINACIPLFAQHFKKSQSDPVAPVPPFSFATSLQRYGAGGDLTPGFVTSDIEHAMKVTPSPKHAPTGDLVQTSATDAHDVVVKTYQAPGVPNLTVYESKGNRPPPRECAACGIHLTLKCVANPEHVSTTATAADVLEIVNGAYQCPLCKSMMVPACPICGWPQTSGVEMERRRRAHAQKEVKP